MTTLTNTPAEFNLLAGLIHNPDLYFELAEFLSIDDFSQHSHRQLFTVLQRLLLDLDGGEIVVTEGDLLAKAAELNLKTFHEDLDDGELLRSCYEHKAKPSDAARAFSQVKRETVKRTLLDALRTEASYLKDTEDQVDQIISHVEDRLIAANNKLQGATESPIIHLAPRALEIIEQLSESPGQLGVDIGLPTWQRAIGGIRNGAMTFIAASTGQGKCLTGDTKVYDPDTGRYQLMKDMRGGFVWSYNQTSNRMERAPVLGHTNNGTREVFKLNTRSGRSIKATANHPFLTCAGFRELHMLRVGHHIALPKFMPEPLSPISCSRAYAKFVGYMIAEGYCVPNMYSFTNMDHGVIHEFESSVNALGISFYTRKQGNSTSFQLSGEINREILSNTGLFSKRSGDKNAEWAASLSNNILMDFLAAYWDGDGRVHVGLGGTEISCCSKSEQLMDNIQDLLTRFGIWTRKRTRSISCADYYELKVITQESMERFCRTVGQRLKHTMKRDMVVNVLNKILSNLQPNRTYDVIDRELLDIDLSKIECRKLASELKRGDRKNISRERIVPISHLCSDEQRQLCLSNDIIYDEIVSIHSVGMEEVFDIEVGHNHNFCANGIIVHNSQLGVRAAIELAKLGLPVLVCDSELNELAQSVRVFGQFAGINYEILETGYWKADEATIRDDGYDETFIRECKVAQANIRDENLRVQFKALPIYYHSINGMSARDALPFLRRWVMQHVGIDNENRVPRCLIVWDYVKLAHVSEVKSAGVGAHDLIGADCAALHDFAEKYNLPIIAFGQTNRSIDESIDCIAGAKKIAELSDSVSLFKRKSSDELQRDSNGSHMLKVFKARYGKGIQTHINLQGDLSIGVFKDLGVSVPTTIQQDDDDDDGDEA